MTEKLPLSVIIPVHNGETHLRECLDSVLRQTHADLEVIVVDDSSTDRTPIIISEYQSSARRPIRIITQEQNLGVSAARNAGIAAASGEFVAFVDADDLVRPRMYEHLLSVAHTSRCEVVSCALQLFDNQGRLTSPTPYPIPSGTVHDSASTRRLLIHGFTSKLLWFPVRSIYRTELVRVHNIVFDVQIQKGEDVVFNLEVLARAEGCAAVPDAYYLYRKHPSSVTARPLPNESRNLQRLGDRVTGFLESEGFPAAAVDDFYRYLLSSDIPTALVRLSGSPHAAREIRKLKSERHVQKALGELRRLEPGMSWRVELLLLALKYAHPQLVRAALAGFTRHAQEG